MSDNEYEQVQFNPTEPGVTVADKNPPGGTSASSVRPRPKPAPRPSRPVYEVPAGQNQEQRPPQINRRQTDASKLQLHSQSRTPTNAGRSRPPPIPRTPRPVLLSHSGPKTPPSSQHVHPENALGKQSPDKHSPSTADGSALPSTSKEEEPMSLGDFMTRHSSSLPLRVRVDKGFCGAEERCVISAGDIYNIHFIKRTKVVSMKDSGNGQYTIPLNSAIEFGPLYDPHHNFKEAFKGFTFDAVADILALKGPLPKLLRVTRAHQGSDPKSSVEEGELLIVKKAARTGVMRKPVLKVFSVTAKEEKTLFDDCIGQFTTHPYSAHTFLPEILQQIPDPFPMAAMLYISSETSDDLPVHLTSEVVNLSHSSIETSLIATSCWEGSVAPSEEENIPIEIPIHLDIEVTIISSEESQNQQLFSDTRDLYEKFDPSKVQNYKDAPSGNEYAAQSTIYRVVRHGYEREGLELEKPALVYENPKMLKRPTPEIPSKLPSKASSEKSTDAPPVVSRTNSVSNYKSSSDIDVQKQVSALQSSQRSLKAMVDAFQDNSGKQFANIRAELARISPIVDGTSRQFKAMQVELSRLKQQVQKVSGTPSTPDEKQPQTENHVQTSVEDQNKTSLRSLTHIQVRCINW